jgi:large subunit ribosomal protein L18
LKKDGRVPEKVCLQHTPAAYLTGYLAGKKALVQGAKDAIMYTGTRRYTQRMAAALKGIVDAGVKVPADEKTFPPNERINGEHLTVKNEISKIKSSIDRTRWKR